MARSISIIAVVLLSTCTNNTNGFPVVGPSFSTNTLGQYRRLGLIGGKDLRPVWLREGLEKPRGTKNMGTWTAWVYTKEQMERLGVDENGRSVGEDEDLDSLGIHERADGKTWRRRER